jgi:hypothetical protein
MQIPSRFGGYDTIKPLRLSRTGIFEETLAAEYRHIARQIVPRVAQLILELNTVDVSLRCGPGEPPCLSRGDVGRYLRVEERDCGAA